MWITAQTKDRSWTRARVLGLICLAGTALSLSACNVPQTNDPPPDAPATPPAVSFADLATQAADAAVTAANSALELGLARDEVLKRAETAAVNRVLTILPQLAEAEYRPYINAALLTVRLMTMKDAPAASTATAKAGPPSGPVVTPSAPADELRAAIKAGMEDARAKSAKLRTATY